MKASVFAEAVRWRFARIASMKALMSCESLHGKCTDKGPRQNFPDTPRNTSFLFARILLFSISVFLICNIEPGWNAIDQGWPPAASTPVLGRPMRALKSSTEINLEATGKTGALHGMGVTFRIGSRVMNELIIAHLDEQTTLQEFKMFLRTLHRSGVTARADVVFLFPWSLTEDFTAVIDEEELSFRRLMKEMQSSAPPHRRKNSKNIEGAASQNPKKSIEDRMFILGASETRPFHEWNLTISPFNTMAFWKSREESRGRGDMIWENHSAADTNGSDETDSLNWGDWGSIVAFEMQDLDQDEVLKGFIETPPAQLRRWICYQMLFGLVKSKYRSVLLSEVAGVFILGDVLAAARKKKLDSGISVYEEDEWDDSHVARELARQNKLTTSTRAEGTFTGIVQGALERDKTKPDSASLKRFKREVPIFGMKIDGGPGDLTKKGVSLRSEEESMPDFDKISGEMQEMHVSGEIQDERRWSFPEKEEKKPVLSSAFIMGNMRHIRSLSNAMLTKIAALAMSRKSRQPFHDRGVLNHLILNSSVLTKKVAGKLHILTNKDSCVHSLPASKQRRVFFREDGRRFAALLGLKDDLVAEETAVSIARTIGASICATQSDSEAYGDCGLKQSIAK